MGNMRKITTLCVALMIAAAGMAEVYGLSYEGFPYNKTLCEGPTYAAGAAVKLTDGIPTKDEVPLVGWSYNGTIYQPGATFIMPAEDVVLVPVWEGSEGIETVNGEWRMANGKMIRDGQLLINRDGKVYNVMGVRIQ